MSHRIGNDLFRKARLLSELGISRRLNRERCLWRGLLSGAVGGLVGSWSMNQFQSIWTRALYGFETPHGAQSLQRGAPNEGAMKVGGPADDATERVAELVSDLTTGHSPSDEEKRKGGTAVHYAFGVSAGAMYGIAAEHFPTVTRGAGSLFGTLFWVTVDEGMIPLLGLSKSAKRYPTSTHAYALASHIVYGVTSEVVRRSIRGAA